jgi:hypothetical protein
MNKKSYITPTIRVRTVNVEPLLAGSQKYLPYSPDSDTTNESLSKSNEFWDY